MLVDWNAIGIMGTVAGSVGGIGFYLGRKIGAMVTKEQCNAKHTALAQESRNLNGEMKEINSRLGRIEGALNKGGQK